MGISNVQVITCDGCKATVDSTADFIVLNVHTTISGQSFSGVACKSDCVQAATATVVVPTAPTSTPAPTTQGA